MFEEILKSFYYFLPAYLANAAPVIFDKFRLLKSLKKPIDGGRKMGNDYIFGTTKTWRGLVAGVLVGTLTGLLQAALYLNSGEAKGMESPWFFFVRYNFENALFLGALLGFGILVGDLVKSFFKRRLHIKSTDPFFPFDQLDYLGALFLGTLFFPIPLLNFLIILLLSPLLPILANITAYTLGWKKVWW